MLEDIHYWDPNSWKEFVRNKIVLLRDLASATSDMLALDPLGEVAKDIASIAGNLVRASEEKFGESMGTFSVGEEDVLEVARRFLELGANTTAGHCKHTFFAWSIRKITKIYLEDHYSELKEPDKFKALSDVLGLQEYWSPPDVKSRIVGGYVAYCFPDYRTLFDVTEESYQFRFRISEIPEAPKTVGGSLCKLNERLWKALSERPGLIAGYELPDVFKNYQATCASMLDKAMWKDERGIFTYTPYIGLERIEGVSQNCERLFEFEGLGVKKLRRTAGKFELEVKTSIMEFWDILMPPLFLGRCEFVLTPDKSRGIILTRWR
jgi:hypothetical protein